MQEIKEPSTLLNPAQAAAQLGLTTGALAQMRYVGRGPRYRFRVASTDAARS